LWWSASFLASPVVVIIDDYSLGSFSII